MNLKNLKLTLTTIKFLLFKQVYYRGYYIFKNKFFKRDYNESLECDIIPLVWENSFFNGDSFLNDYTFNFLNISHTFKNEIDWNHNAYGKLWTYNLNYFDFLNQESIKVKHGLNLIIDYLNSDSILKDGKEPYPISLRGINWIKFLSKNNKLDPRINQILYNHYQILYHNLEYHLLGNHLLENGFSLFFGAYYFKNDKFYKKAFKILQAELNEQILDDGAHFELSPMYHQILLYRLLDCIHLVQLNPGKKDSLITFLKERAINMLSWLQAITYKNGYIPMFNDCTYDIAPKSAQLFTYAKKLGLKWEKAVLSESGYRKFENDKYELFIDAGNVGPDYQPGHAHSDTFSFELYVNNKPIIVDTGTSTYEKDQRRQIERQTESHNTVKIGDKDQTEVWGGFRVAKRAKILNFKEEENFIEATHDGYKDIGILHTRNFKAQTSNIIIRDTLSGRDNNFQVAYFHFHPSIEEIGILENTITLSQINVSINFKGSLSKIEKETYEYALGFNKREKAFKLKVYFEKHLETNIKL